MYNPERKKLLIPFKYLHGTQDLSEFQNRLFKETDHQLQKYGFDYYRVEPLKICLEAAPHGLIASLIDGHHKARLARKYKIEKMPARIVTLDEVALSLNVPIQVAADQLEYSRAKALHDFASVLDRKNKQYMPQVIPGVSLEMILSLLDGGHFNEQSAQILQCLTEVGISLADDNEIRA